MRRRDLLRGAGSLSCAQFLSYFLANGAPRVGRAAELRAADIAAEAEPPRFLIYWFLEGGWMGYDMFNPCDTPNNVVKRLESPTDERYRILRWGEPDRFIKTKGNIRYGYLAEDGADLFPDLAVLSSMHTGSFHSGERLRAHMGTYKFRLGDEREEDERSVLQAFAEARGQSFLLPHVSWHWWLADGELNEAQYTGRRGYYHALGPPHAHTIYPGAPARLKRFMAGMRNSAADPVNRQIQDFIERIDGRALGGPEGEEVRAFHSARSIHLNMARRGLSIEPALLSNFFTDPVLREEFKIQPEDEVITYRGVNGNKARTKYTPAVNVQAMMTWELIRAGYSCAYWLETRGIRDFDHHFGRRGLWGPDGTTPVGQIDTTDMMRRELWDPLKTLVAKLKAQEHGNTGKSLWDLTTIVLTSEFGRSIHGDVEAIQKMPIPEAEKRKMILDQDISQHWMVTSAAFLGGSVKGDAQYGRVGERTILAIPIMPDGSLDPNYDPVTGLLREGKSKAPESFIPDHGTVYATALHLAGVEPKGRGRNEGEALKFIGRG